MSGLSEALQQRFRLTLRMGTSTAVGSPLRAATESWSSSGEVTPALRSRALAAGSGLTTTTSAYMDLREVVSGSVSQGAADTFQ